MQNRWWNGLFDLPSPIPAKQFPMALRVLLFLITFSLLASLAQAQKQTARLNHLAIFVKDLSKSDTFYRQVIGLDSIAEPFHDGKHRWLSMGPGQSLHIIEGAVQTRSYFKNHHICFSVVSLEKFTKTLRSRNIVWENVTGQAYSVTRRVDGVQQLWLQDPDGYWIDVNDAKE